MTVRRWLYLVAILAVLYAIGRQAPLLWPTVTIAIAVAAIIVVMAPSDRNP